MTTVKKLKEPTKAELKEIAKELLRQWEYYLWYNGVKSKKTNERISEIRKKLNL